MSAPFNSDGVFIPVPVRLFGAQRYASALLALDTGATQTMISRDVVESLGYDVANAYNAVRLVTASGEEITPIIDIVRFEALEQERQNLPILCHNLPSGAPFDGLLGLDFFRGQRLTLDFREGLITLD